MVTVPGTRRRSFEGYQTFIPDPLPPEFRLTPAIDRKIEEAIHLLGRVEASQDLLSNADLLVYGSLQREALASSTIEGTIASPDELVLFQVSRLSPREAVREVANYRDALEWGYQEIRTRPITTNLILDLHAILMDNVRGAAHAGRFKEHQNAIGTHERQRIEDAIFVPPPPQDTLGLMSDLARYVNADNPQLKVVQCALTHYQFETIHPFRDGNGRVGRLLIVLQMIALGLLSAPLIYPSVYFERTRADYYGALQGVRDRGAWSAWIEYFVEGVQAQCEETIELTQTILKLQRRLHTEVAHVRRRHSVDAVVGAFFEDPVLTAKDISERATMSIGAVRTALGDLHEMGIVEEITGKRRDRIYSCEPLFDVIFGRD